MSRKGLFAGWWGASQPEPAPEPLGNSRPEGERVLLLSTLYGEVPTPRPVRAMDRWRVAWHGHRNVRSVPFDAPESWSYVESLRAQAEAGQRAVGAWLHDKLVPIDVEAAELLIVLDQHRRDPAIPPRTIPSRSAPDHAEAKSASRIPSWVREARELAAAQKEFARRISERDEAEQRLAHLGSIRHHFIEIARAAVHAHIARYEHLAALYQAALLRRQPDQHQTTPHPGVSTVPWLHGDMPLLALDLDRELAEAWYLKEFEARTSARKRPILEQAPRAS